MRVLAIDPSLTATGWILVDGEAIAFGCIRTEPESKKRGIYKSDDTTRRLELILKEINRVVWQELDPFEMPPIKVACEQPAGSQSASAAAALGEVHGALVGFFYCEGLLPDVRWVPARDGKRALTGKPNSSKENMITYAQAWLGLRGRALEERFADLTKRAQEAVADALGVMLASGLWKPKDAVA